MDDAKSEAVKALKEGDAHLFTAELSSQYVSHSIDGKKIVGIYYGDDKPHVFVELDEAFSLISESELTWDEIIDAFKVLIICEGINIDGFLRAHDEKLKLDSLIENEDLKSGLSF